MIKITKNDPFTGKDNTYDLDITEDQYNRWQAGEHIQNVMPNLSADEREFLISGMPIGKFDEIFKEEEPTFAEHEKEKYQNGDMMDDDDFEPSSIEDIEEIYEDYDEGEDEYLTDDERGLTQM